jgi:hypothetical protein
MIPKTQRIDFEALGYKTMVETGDQMGTMEICANQIHSFALELKPKLLRRPQPFSKRRVSGNRFGHISMTGPNP